MGFCVFRRLTGGYCPACGMSRAVWRLLRFDVPGALREHPLVFLLPVPVLRLAIDDQRRRPNASNRLAWAGVVVGLVVWLFRLAHGSIPRPKAPRARKPGGYSPDRPS